MRVLIVADELFASREQALLSRLEVGLADEGTRVIHAIPRAAASYAPGDMISRVLEYKPRKLGFAVDAEARRMAANLSSLQSAESETPTVIHVFGGGAWGIGASLARRFNAILAVEAWRCGLAERARRLAMQAGLRVLFLAPDSSIERELGQPDGSAEQLTIRPCRWGVIAPTVPNSVLEPGRAAALMMVGTGRDVRAFTSALQGIALALREVPDALVFCDSQAARRSNLWALARKLKFEHRLSLIGELEGRRDLVMHGDVLVQPEAGGEQRSVTLDAMAHGMLVAAAEDRNVSSLVDGMTARLVKTPTAEAWSAVITDIFKGRDRARSLGNAARAFVKDQRKASAHVRSVLDAYEWMKSGGAIKFGRTAA